MKPIKTLDLVVETLVDETLSVNTLRGVYSSVYYPPRGVEKKKLIYKKREKKKLEIYALWRELAYLEIKTLFLWFQNIKKSGGKKMSQEFFRFCYRFFLFPVFFLTYLEGKEKVEIYVLWRE